MMALKFDLKNAQLSVVNHMQVTGEELQASDGLCSGLCLQAVGRHIDGSYNRLYLQAVGWYIDGSCKCLQAVGWYIDGSCKCLQAVGWY